MEGALDGSVYYGLSMYFQETKRIFYQRNQHDCPGKLKVVGRMKDVLTSLLKLFNHATPPKRPVRGEDVCTTRYGFVDTPGSFFGASW